LSSRIQRSHASAAVGQAATHSWSLQARQTLITGACGHSTSTRMRDRFVVFSPKCRQQQICMQIWHSVHRERLILIIIFTVSYVKVNGLLPMLPVVSGLRLYHEAEYPRQKQNQLGNILPPSRSEW
jgi:hypothetical protein